ncbi:hypothetical protein CCHR01_12075 [Colletotrichum chrysophilum]|uniref:Uncharacterized protein n=1 Tax=Colletotrichum chrysophilum TaxID=1836956 RepID=A0AAD9AEQ9_9PEZI|nr:hypothetical protein CCHR01_12075 [Colletotrichum chrysophilum]
MRLSSVRPMDLPAFHSPITSSRPVNVARGGAEAGPTPTDEHVPDLQVSADMVTLTNIEGNPTTSNVSFG